MSLCVVDKVSIFVRINTASEKEGLVEGLCWKEESRAEMFQGVDDVWGLVCRSGGL